MTTEVWTWLVQAEVLGQDAGGAQPLLREADAWMRRGGATPLQIADFELTRSYALQFIGALEEAAEASARAVELRASVFGAAHLSVAIAELTHAQHVAGRGATDDAILELRRAERTIRDAVGDAHMLCVDASYNLGVTLIERGDPESLAEARQLLERAAATTRELRGATAIELADAAISLAQVAHLEGERDEAARRLDEAVAIFERYPDRPDRADALSFRGVVLADAGRYEEARADHIEARQIYAAAGQRDRVALTDCNLGEVSLALGAYTRAESHFTASIAGLRETLGDAAPLLVEPVKGLTEVLRQQERPCEAVVLLTSPWLPEDDPALADELAQARIRCSTR